MRERLVVLISSVGIGSGFGYAVASIAKEISKFLKR
jgi:hypothetical protein